jgi:GT2 family glycosyltransferase
LASPESKGASTGSQFVRSESNSPLKSLETGKAVNGRTARKSVSCSAIIPTRNRPTDLRLTVQTLLDQTLLPEEVIVIDQSPDEQSRKAVEEEFQNARDRNSFTPELKYVLDSKIVGVSAARNRAMELCTKAIWLFLDDDIIIEREFVEELQIVYDENPEIHGVSGVITNYRLPQFVHRTWMSLFFRGPFLEKRLPIYWRADRLRNAGLFPVAGFSGGLMSFRSEVARTGKFDTRIGDGEDVDFCLNLGIKANMVIAPRARLKHMSSPVGRSNDLWLSKFAATQGFLYEKNWSHRWVNKIYLGWLCVGLFSAAFLSCWKRRSFAPIVSTFKSLRAGMDKARTRAF